MNMRYYTSCSYSCPHPLNSLKGTARGKVPFPRVAEALAEAQGEFGVVMGYKITPIFMCWYNSD